MPVHKYNAQGSVQTLLTTDLDGLANNARSAASTAFANGNVTHRQLFGSFELVVAFSSAPVAGKTVDLYLLPTLDGTNYADGSASAEPSQTSYGGSFAVRNVTTAQRLVLVGVPLPASDFKVQLINRAGQAFSASGHALKLAAYSYESV
jgi:hypothetical protein